MPVIGSLNSEAVEILLGPETFDSKTGAILLVGLDRTHGSLATAFRRSSSSVRG